MKPEKFYKMRLEADELGLTVVTTEYKVIGESNCYYYVIKKYDEALVSVAGRLKTETPVQCARRLKKLKKIDKISSRFAFETEEKAYQHLVFLKKKQLGHMKREIAFLQKFIEADCTLAEMINMQVMCHNKYRTIPGTEEIVNQFLRFD